MAGVDKKLPDLTELTTPSDGSFIHVVEPLDISQSPEGSSYKVKKSNFGGLSDAPSNGQTYGRKDAAWVAVSSTDTTADHFIGSWNATTNSPTLTNGVGQVGDYYVVNNAGTQFGIDFGEGDIISYNGTTWYKYVDNNQAPVLTTNTNITSSVLSTQDVAGFVAYINGLVSSFSVAVNEIRTYTVTDTGQKFQLLLRGRSFGGSEPDITTSDVLELEIEDGLAQSQWHWSFFDTANATNNVFNGFAMNSGTVSSISTPTPLDDYQNMKQFFSSTSANSGYRYLTITGAGPGSSRFFTQKGLTYFATFCIYSNSGADTIIRLGYADTITQTDATNGAYIEITGTSIVFKTARANVRTTSSAGVLEYSTTTTTEIPYNVMIYFESSTEVRCKVVKYDGSVILNVLINTNVPLNTNSFHAIAIGTITTAGTARPIYGISKIGLGIRKPNFLKLF